jgi:hypothetical protein
MREDDPKLAPLLIDPPQKNTQYYIAALLPTILRTIQQLPYVLYGTGGNFLGFWERM